MGIIRGYWNTSDSRTAFSYHSNAFHSFFEGYEERTETDPASGKTKLVRVYTAPYHLRLGTPGERLRSKLLTALGYITSLAAFITSVTALDIAAPTVYYQASVAAACFGYFFTLYTLLHYLAAPYKMTVGQYRGFVPGLRRMSFFTAVALFAALAARLAAGAFVHSPAADNDVWGGVCLCGGALIMTAVWLCERRAVYDMLDNEIESRGGIRING